MGKRENYGPGSVLIQNVPSEVAKNSIFISLEGSVSSFLLGIPVRSYLRHGLNPRSHVRLSKILKQLNRQKMK